MKQALVAIAVLSLFLVGALFRHGSSSKPTVIRLGVATAGVGTPPIFGGSSAATAQMKGMVEDEFKADGVKVEWVFFKGAGPAVNEALANNQLDFAFQGDLPSILGKASGIKTRILLASAIRADVYLAVPPGSRVGAVGELRGKRVAIFKGTNLQLGVAKVLEANGLAERDLKVLNLDFAATQVALANQDVDAAFGGFELLVLRDKGAARIVYSSKGDSPAFTRHAHVLVAEAFEQKYPKVVGRVVKALVKSARWTSDEANRDEVFQLWGRTGIPVSVWNEANGGDPMKLRHSPLFDDFLVHRYKQAVADSLRFKFIRNDIDVDNWIDTTYLNTALHDLKLEDYWTPYDANGAAEGT